MRKAIIDSQGLVLNVIEIEEDSTWQVPEGCELIDAGDGSPGDTWDGENFIKPEPVIPPEDLNMTTLRAYITDPHSGLPDLETAFIALVKLYLGEE